jgi:hypothetical protein
LGGFEKGDMVFTPLCLEGLEGLLALQGEANAIGACEFVKKGRRRDESL